MKGWILIGTDFTKGYEYAKVSARMLPWKLGIYSIHALTISLKMSQVNYKLLKSKEPAFDE